jgi:hypothetical protein
MSNCIEQAEQEKNHFLFFVGIITYIGFAECSDRIEVLVDKYANCASEHVGGPTWRSERGKPIYEKCSALINKKIQFLRALDFKPSI